MIQYLKIGDRVRYQPPHYGLNEWENGIVKEVRENMPDYAWVVYNCNGEWSRYQEYTSAKTHLDDLKIGWRLK